LKTEDDAYNAASILLKDKKTIGHTTSIIEWMMAHNLLIRKVNIPIYNVYDIDNMSPIEINKLAKLLTMKGNNINNIKNILKYLNKLQDDYDIIFTKIKDVDIKILLDLNDYELNKICRTNKYINTLCNDDYFWKFKLDKLVSMELFPTDLRNKGKEIYINFKDFFNRQKILGFQLNKYNDLLSSQERDKFKYIANWATINNYLSVLNKLIQLKHFPDQDSINLAAFKGNIEVLNILRNYIKKTSPSNHPSMLKFLSKGIFPNVKGANLAYFNEQHEVLDLLKEFNINPDYDYTSFELAQDISSAFIFKDYESLDAFKRFKSLNIIPTVQEQIKNNNMIILPRTPKNIVRKRL